MAARLSTIVLCLRLLAGCQAARIERHQATGCSAEDHKICSEYPGGWLNVCRHKYHRLMPKCQNCAECSWGGRCTSRKFMPSSAGPYYLPNQPVQGTYAECIELCKADSQCKGFSWPTKMSITYTQDCWFLSEWVESEAKYGEWETALVEGDCAVQDWPQPVRWTEHAGKRCQPQAHRVKVPSATTLDACKAACAEASDCDAANFYDDGTCYKCPPGFELRGSGASSTWQKATGGQ